MKEQNQRTSEQGKDALATGLRDLREQLTQQADTERYVSATRLYAITSWHDSRRAVQETEQRQTQERKQALDELYQDLQQRFTAQLNAQLADQRQSLLGQAAREKVRHASSVLSNVNM